MSEDARAASAYLRWQGMIDAWLAHGDTGEPVWLEVAPEAFAAYRQHLDERAAGGEDVRHLDGGGLRFGRAIVTPRAGCRGNAANIRWFRRVEAA